LAGIHLPHKVDDL